MKKLLNEFSKFVKKFRWPLIGIYTVGLLYIMFIKHILPSSDMIFFILWVYAALLGHGKSFFLAWWPFMLLFIIYEYSRGAASHLHEFFNITVHKSTLYVWEKGIFGENIPTYWLQRLVKDTPTALDLFAFIIYTSFFWFAAVAGFIIWFVNKKLFEEFKLGYLILSFSGYITYVLFPAYPPWLAAAEGIIPPIKQSVWDVLPAGKTVTAVFHKVGYNPVAPFPSLHCGWSVFVAIMFDKMLAPKFGLWSKLSYLYPVAMIFTVVYTGDHYIVDAIGGIIYAVASVLLSKWILARFGKKSENKVE